MRTLSLLLVISLALAAQDDKAGPTAAASAKPTQVIHELTISGAYMDLPASGFDVMSLIAGGGGKPKAFYTLIADLAKVEGGSLLVDLSNPALGLNGAQLTELSRAFKKLRGRGVHATAYLENASSAHYRVASFSDRVVMADMGMLDFHAPGMAVMFFKGVMDLLGVDVQVTRCGDFKGAVEPFMRERMSEHLKRHYERMLETMNAHVVSGIAERRGITIEKVRELQGQRLISAKDAKDGGLVDEIVPWKGPRSVIAKDDGTTFKRVGKKEKKKGLSLMSLLSGGSSKAKVRITKPSIVVLHLSGAIEDGRKASAGAIVSGPTVELVKQLTTEDNVKGVVVRVNSPGGSATASEAILLALRDLGNRKPVVVSMGEMAASGGYYISMIGCPILTERETITGSIGVFGMRPNFKELSEIVGIHQEVVAIDPGAAAMENVFAPLGEKQTARIQAMVNDVYRRFQDRILEARKLDRKELLKIAGGRVWSGAQAKELGLVDQIGGLHDALAMVIAKAGEGHAELHLPKPVDNPLGPLGSLLGAAVRQHEDRLGWLAQAGFRLDGPLRILLDAMREPAAMRTWAMLPAELRIR